MGKPYDGKNEEELNKDNPGNWITIEHNLILQPKGYTVSIFDPMAFPETIESFYADPSEKLRIPGCIYADPFDKAAIERFWQEVE